MRFELITPEGLHGVWDYVKTGLARIQEASPERWRAEDVYAQCRYKLAHLYLGYDGDHCRGFFIVQVLKQPFSSEPYLNVWVLYGEPTRGEHCAEVTPFQDETIAFLDNCAKHHGAKWIEFRGRWGWSRYAKQFFKAKQVIYEREVAL
jgi:hypothetical protein